MVTVLLLDHRVRQRRLCISAVGCVLLLVVCDCANRCCEVPTAAQSVARVRRQDLLPMFFDISYHCLLFVVYSAESFQIRWQYIPGRSGSSRWRFIARLLRGVAEQSGYDW